MRLEKIKLSGFKSFVDQTVIPITSNLTAIVGPNGCGKSNIIDAVRWVMGESSAKHLRGGNMADVIFNGSSGRKPVSTASVELIFDNTAKKLGGEYANYDSIEIKRQVSRDGTSVFMLNGSRCRRKDITDIFLGTGLGSRSYAIIEQGTISRMVEAKPDELRVHIEEAAGVSKYKERRSETETRMKHTRENLERLNDLRDEVEKQIKHLQKQAEKAEKYIELKKQERQYKLELLAMRWDSYYQLAKQLDEKLQTAAEEHNRLFVCVRDGNVLIEHKREQYKTQQQLTNNLQGDYYQLVADISSLEQTIRHNERSREQTSLEIHRLQQQARQSMAELEADTLQLEETKQALFAAEQALTTAEAHQERCLFDQQETQQRKLTWQQQWDDYRTSSASYKEQIEVQRTKITQLENQQRQLQIRLDKAYTEREHLEISGLQNEIESLAMEIEDINTERNDLQQQLDDIQHQIREQRQQIKQNHEQLHGFRSELHNAQGKITALELLQQHAMGKDNQRLSAWLVSAGLQNSRRLAESLEVQSGWEKAVETVMGTDLEAICLERADDLLMNLPQLTEDSVMLLETSLKSLPVDSGRTSRLIDKIRAPWSLESLLGDIYCADDIEQARKLSAEMSAHESVITPDGFWFGPGWVRVIRSKDSKSGLLQREKDLRLLKQQQVQLQNQVDMLEDQLITIELDLKDAENQRESLQQQAEYLNGELSEKTALMSAHSARHEHQQRRLTQVAQEIEEINEGLAEQMEAIFEARQLQEQAGLAMAEQEQTRELLDGINQDLQSRQQLADQVLEQARQLVFRLRSQIESLRSSEVLTIKQLERVHFQHQQSIERIAELEHNLELALLPMDEEKLELEKLVDDRQQLEARLKLQRHNQEEMEAEISQLSEQQMKMQHDLEQQKQILDSVRFDLQECRVRQQTVNEQLKEIDAEIECVLQQLPEQADEQTWKKTVDELVLQIERLGTINLTAIEEFQAQTQRMDFLNEQQADLLEALQTLDQAINKIDKESRQRFKETFDKINLGLQEKFPKLFGGGHAYLELSTTDVSNSESSDSQEAGVNIIARPPGKKNSSIHLLSGGEKALTAVALVFSIFELNPAPFCLLDEVDAPLDDANVVRFSKMVEEMSESVQFLYISHNKATMEIAKQLTGVTMKEPGVSRMVAVDIEEAVSLAES